MAALAPPSDDRLTQTGPAIGFDPDTVAAGWLEPLAAAGVPFATGGTSWPGRIDPSLTIPVVNEGNLWLPPLERFRNLTSLPLKPVRTWIHFHFGVRLRVAAGIHLWLWGDRLAVVNRTEKHRSGFLHGPQHGMRTVIALDPGRHQVVAW